MSEKLIELKPCPFCGAHLVPAEALSTRKSTLYLHPEIEGEWCPASGARVWSAQAETVEGWNRRAASELERLTRERDEALKGAREWKSNYLTAVNALSIRRTKANAGKDRA